MSAKRKMPTKVQIIKHWVDEIADKKFWVDAFYDATTADEIAQTTSICFACGGFFGTQRCHIIPRWAGGADDVENLHLLCPECHLESEQISNKGTYFKWFYGKNPTNSGSYARIANKLIVTKQQILAGDLDCIDEKVLAVFLRANIDLNEFALIEDGAMKKLVIGAPFMFVQ